GRIDEAEKETRRAIELDANNAKAHFNLANILVRQNKIGDAVDEFQTVIRLDADHYRAHNNLGMIYATQGKLDLAGRHFYNAVRVNQRFERQHEPRPALPPPAQLGPGTATAPEHSQHRSRQRRGQRNSRPGAGG